MKNSRRIIAALIVLIFSISIVGCGSKTLATVNSEKITQKDLDARMNKVKLALESQGASFSGAQGQQMLDAIKQQTLDEMITEALILQAAKKEGVLPSKSDTEKAVQEIKTKFGGEEEFQKALKQYGYTVKEIEELWVSDAARTKLFEKVSADVKVSENEIKDWYDNNKDKYKDPAKIKARAILIKYNDPQAPAMGQDTNTVKRTEDEAKKLAEDIVKQLDSGADFEKLAKEKSEDDGSKDEGGLIKDFAGNSPYSKGMMPREFDDAAVALKPGQYTKTPVKTGQGFYVIKLESLTAEKQLTFEESKEKINQELLATKKQEKFNEYMAKLRKDSKIENKLEKEAPKQAPPQSGGQELPPGHPPTTPDDSQSSSPKTEK